MEAGRVILAALAVAIVAASPAAGAPEQTAKRGGTLVAGTLAEPACLNAYLLRCHGTTPVGGFLTGVALRGAFRAGSGALPRPDRVKDVVITNGRPFTLRYHLRPQARWSDGTPIAARDFVFTYEAPRATRRQSWARDADVLRRVRRVRAVGAKTVEVVLGSPWSGWRGLFPNVLPSHALRGANLSKVFLDGVSDPRTGEPIGSGPFLVESWKRGRQVTFVQNPRYWGSHRAHLDRIVFRFCRRCDDMAAEQAQLLRTGELDLA